MSEPEVHGSVLHYSFIYNCTNRTYTRSVETPSFKSIEEIKKSKSLIKKHFYSGIDVILGVLDPTGEFLPLTLIIFWGGAS